MSAKAVWTCLSVARNAERVGLWHGWDVTRMNRLWASGCMARRDLCTGNMQNKYAGTCLIIRQRCMTKVYYSELLSAKGLQDLPVTHVTVLLRNSCCLDSDGS